MLSQTQIDALLAGRPACDREPWASQDETAVDAHYRRICHRIEREAAVRSRIEWDHYGSGYASFVDAWFYREDAAFRRTADPSHYTGLVVLLCRLGPYYVLMEGEKSWQARGGSSYLPSEDEVDRLATPAVSGIADSVQEILAEEGLTRLSRQALATSLPAGTHVPTVLAASKSRYAWFDALFHWED